MSNPRTILNLNSSNLILLTETFPLNTDGCEFYVRYNSNSSLRVDIDLPNYNYRLYVDFSKNSRRNIGFEKIKDLGRIKKKLNDTPETLRSIFNTSDKKTLLVNNVLKSLYLDGINRVYNDNFNIHDKKNENNTVVIKALAGKKLVFSKDSKEVHIDKEKLNLLPYPLICDRYTNNAFGLRIIVIDVSGYVELIPIGHVEDSVKLEHIESHVTFFDGVKVCKFV